MPAMPCGYGREFGPGTLTKEVASSELAARVAFTRIFWLCHSKWLIAFQRKHITL